MRARPFFAARLVALSAVATSVRALDGHAGGGVALQLQHSHLVHAEQGPCAAGDPTCTRPPSPPPTQLSTIRTRILVDGSESDFTNASIVQELTTRFAAPLNISANETDGNVALLVIAQSTALGGLSAEVHAAAAAAAAAQSPKQVVDPAVRSQQVVPSTVFLVFLVVSSDDGSTAILNETIRSAMPSAEAASALLNVNAVSTPAVQVDRGQPPDTTALAPTTVDSPPPPPSPPPPSAPPSLPPSPPPSPPPPPWFIAPFNYLLFSLLLVGLLLLVIAGIVVYCCTRTPVKKPEEPLLDGKAG